MVRAVYQRPLIAKAWVESRSSPCEFCGELILSSCHFNCNIYLKFHMNIVVKYQNSER
jgi:hypothetical protein